jgi:hypothetical protein
VSFWHPHCQLPCCASLTTPGQRRWGWGALIVLGAVLMFAPSFIGNSDAPEVRFAQVHESNDSAHNEHPATDDPLPCIRKHESGGNYQAVSKSGKHRGAYQFDRSTWDSNARQGPHYDWVGADPARAPEDIQDSQARVLHARRGLQPWSKSVRRNCR